MSPRCALIPLFSALLMFEIALPSRCAIHHSTVVLRRSPSPRARNWLTRMLLVSLLPLRLASHFISPGLYWCPSGNDHTGWRGRIRISYGCPKFAVQDQVQVRCKLLCARLSTHYSAQVLHVDARQTVFSITSDRMFASPLGSSCTASSSRLLFIGLGNRLITMQLPSLYKVRQDDGHWHGRSPT